MTRKLTAVAVALALAVVVPAQSLGTKPEVTQMATEKTAPLVDATALIQLTVALGVVFLLVKFAMPKLLAKFTNRVSTELGSTIKTCETASCGTSTLQVLEVRGKTLLVALNPSGVNLIADLTATEQAPVEDKPAFFEMLDARKQESVESLLTKAVVNEMPEETKPEPKPEPKLEPKTDDFEESLRLLTEARARMNARQTETPEADVRRERLRKLTG